MIYLVGLPYMGLILNVYLGKGMDVMAILWAGMLPFLPWDAVKIAATVVLAGAVMNVSRRWQSGERWSILPGFLIAAGIAFAVLVALDWFGGERIAWLADLGVGLLMGVVALDVKK